MTYIATIWIEHSADRPFPGSKNNISPAIIVRAEADTPAEFVDLIHRRYRRNLEDQVEFGPISTSTWAKR